jgi:uncharacterized membrane protein YfhO
VADSHAALGPLDPAAGSVVVPPHAPILQDPTATATIVSHDEQSMRIRYRAVSPSLLRLSLPWFPGWRAAADGIERPIVRVDHALMGAIVPPGEHEIEIRFRSNWFRLSVCLSLTGVLGAVFLAARGGRR